MLHWFQSRESARQALREQPFPEAYRGYLHARAPFYAKLPDVLRARLEEFVKIFVAEKTFIGAGGLTMTDEIKVVVAASAVRLVLKLALDRFDRLSEIVVYPDAYRRPDEQPVYLGEAHAWGTVVLSWASVLEGLKFEHDGHDTTLHEMAHVLDRADGNFNGAPALRARGDYRPWALAMSDHYARLKQNARPENQVLDGYAATNEAEFFAVATETFFERPEAMQRLLPDLYHELSRFYGWHGTE